MGSFNLYGFSTWVLPVAFSIVLHEIAHGYAALFFGDRTAKERGRLSLNPLSHVDPVGTVLFPAFLFLAHAPFMLGWARPVPVNFNRLKRKRDMVWVSLAGPLTNVVLAFLFAWIYKGLSYTGDGFPADWFSRNAYNFVIINLVLAAFNLFPLPPLDGGRILQGLLPVSFSNVFVFFERFGFFLVIALFLLPSLLGPEYNVIGKFVGFVIRMLAKTPLFPDI